MLEDIKRTYGCDDSRQWVINPAARMTEEEKLGNDRISIEFYQETIIAKGDSPLRIGGDMMLIPLYSKLRLHRICSEIMKTSKAKFDLDEILKKNLVTMDCHIVL